MLTTSLKKLYDYGSLINDTEEFKKLLSYYDRTYESIDDLSIPYSDLVELTDMDFAIDCTFASSELHKTWREFCLWCCQELVSYTTLTSCKDAMATAIRYQMDLATTEELSQSHSIAMTEHLHDTHKEFGLAHYANAVAVHASNPNVSQAISECYNSYALGMERLGQSFETSERKQKLKFLELVG